MVPSPAGEDDVVRCVACGYAANIERATSRLEPIADGDEEALEKFATPGVVTIAALEAFEGGAPANRQLKSLVMVADGQVVAAVVRGDHQLNLQKLGDALGAADIRPAEPEETEAALGAKPGSLGPVGVRGITVVVDLALEGRTNMVTGANEDGFHLRGVSVSRDVAVDRWADLREVTAGEACPTCGEPLEIVRCIEAGHIFKLGRKYTEAFGVTVLDEDGTARVPIMGSYGIGIGRGVAAIAETFHDDSGLVWPVAVAPYEVVITVVNVKDEASVAAAESLHAELQAAHIDVLLDDRNARAGVKFADAELIGIPFRITVGPRTLADGQVEFTPRATGDTSLVAVDVIAAQVIDLVEAAR
jgi:prolyl-tRNA synthetase